MVVTHRLAPVSQSEVRIYLLRLMESHRRFIELEAVKVLHPLDKFRLRGRGAGRREANASQLLRAETRAREYRNNRCNQPSGTKLQVRHRGLLSSACPIMSHVRVARRVSAMPSWKQMAVLLSGVALRRAFGVRVLFDNLSLSLSEGD